MLELPPFWVPTNLLILHFTELILLVTGWPCHIKQANQPSTLIPAWPPASGSGCCKGMGTLPKAWPNRFPPPLSFRPEMREAQPLFNLIRDLQGTDLELTADTSLMEGSSSAVANHRAYPWSHETF